MPIQSSAGSPATGVVRPSQTAATMLLGLLRAPPTPRAAHVRAAVHSDAPIAERQRQRREQIHNDLAAAPSGAELINTAERNAEPGSRAFRRGQARSQQAEQFRADRDAFQQAMSKARQSGNTGSLPRPSASPPTETPDRPAERQRLPQGATEAPEPKQHERPAAQSPRTAAPPFARAASMSQATARLAPATAAAQPVDASGASTTPPTTSKIIRGGALQRAEAAAPRGGVSRPQPRGDVRPSHVEQTNRPKTRGAALRAMVRGTKDRADSADQAQRVRQLVRVLRQGLARGLTRIVLQLAPRQLGKLRMEAELEHDTLRLHVKTDTSVAHRLLKHDEATLRATLAAAGIRLEHMEVHPPQPPDARPDDPGREYGGDAGGQGHPDAASDEAGGDVADDGGAASDDGALAGRARDLAGRAPDADVARGVRKEAGPVAGPGSLAAELRVDVVA